MVDQLLEVCLHGWAGIRNHTFFANPVVVTAREGLALVEAQVRGDTAALDSVIQYQQAAFVVFADPGNHRLGHSEHELGQRSVRLPVDVQAIFAGLEEG